MKAFVTGATGFIGSCLVEALVREGADVTCLVRDSSRAGHLSRLSIRMVKGDCTDRASLDGPLRRAEIVFHLAGLTKAARTDDFFRVNAGGTENIVRAALGAAGNLKRFVHLSSLAAAGPSRDGNPLTEEALPMPVSEYGRSKLEGETIVLCRRHEMPVTVIRPPAVYGPRDVDLFVFFRMIKFGIIPHWGAGAYSFIHVHDLVRAIIQASRDERGAGEIFFVSDGTIHTTEEIINAIAASLQKRPLRVRMPRVAVSLIGMLAGMLGRVSIINADKIREIRHPRWICDMSKIRATLGYAPAISLEEGVRWTADWYRTHRWL